MKQILQQIAARHGTPAFVYDLDEVMRRVDLIGDAFGQRFLVSYAVKANPHPHLLRRLRDKAATLDVSSGGELKRALAVGWPAGQLSFTGPAKRTWELQASVDQQIGEVVVESLDEAEELSAIASRSGRRQSVLLRVAPRALPRGFGVNMAGKPTQFGVDEELADDAVDKIKEMSALRLEGFHIYAGTQCLDVKSICENFSNYVEIFRRLAHAHNLRPRKLIFGSGIGIPYHEGTEPVNIEEVAAGTNPLLDAMWRDAALAGAKCYLETGRYVVGEAGYYLTRVLRVKHSRGTAIGLCDGGMNHHLGACGHLGSVLHRNYQMFKVTDEASGGETQPYELVGPLCTSIDTLAHGAHFRDLKAGDVIAVRTSGAYGVTASPVYFINHDPPKEVFLETVQGRLEVSVAAHLPWADIETSALGEAS